VRSAALASTPFLTFARHVVRLNPKSHPRIDPSSSSSSSSSSLGVPLSLALVPSARPTAAPDDDGANLDRAIPGRRPPSSPRRRRADALDDDDDATLLPPSSSSPNARPKSRALLPKHAENIAVVQWRRGVSPEKKPPRSAFARIDRCACSSIDRTHRSIDRTHRSMYAIATLARCEPRRRVTRSRAILDRSHASIDEHAHRCAIAIDHAIDRS